MDEARQQVIDDLIHDAHFRRSEIVTSEVAAEIVDELHNLEASGHAWISDFLFDPADVEVLNDWYHGARLTEQATA